MKSAIRAVAIVGLLLVLGVVIFLWVSHRAANADLRRRVKFENGTGLILLYAIPGGKPYSTESRFSSVLRKALPSPMAKLVLPSYTLMMFGGPSNGLEIYFTLDNPNNKTPDTSYCSQYYAESLDGEACVSGGGLSYTSNGTNTLYSISLNNFPRRQKEFWVKFIRYQYESQNYAETGRLLVHNPFSRVFQEWKPKPLPQTATNGSVKLQLKSFRLVNNSAPKFFSKFLNCDWNLETAISNWANSKTIETTLVDATGNFGTVLSTNEPCWKIATQVYRDRSQDFSDDEKLVITNLALPPLGSWSGIGKKADLGGANLKIIALCRPGIVTLTNGVVESFAALKGGEITGNVFCSSSTLNTVNTTKLGATNCFFVIQSYGGGKLLSSGFDAGGKEFDVLGPEAIMGWNNSILSIFEVTASNLPENINVEFRISQPLLFEFYVDPRDVKR